MVFFGSRASKLKEGRISNVKCTNCDTQTSMDYSIFGKYAHIYWIPTFPTGKKSVFECTNCKRTFKKKELTQQIKHKFELENKPSFPIWYFSGLAVIIGIIFIGIWISKQNDLDNEDYINAPQVGDVYSVKGNQEGYYTLAKVTKVTNDSLHLIFNDYETDKRTGVNKIDKDENYTVGRFNYSRAEILALFKDNIIYDIDRN